MSEYGDDADITGSLIVDGETDLGSGDDDIDIDAGTLYIDAADNRVGIGTESPEAYLDIKNTTDDGATNRTMIQMYNYRTDDADENDWAPTSIDFKIENVAGGVKGATARIATVIAPVGTGHNTTEGERSSALIFSTMDDNTLAEAMRINNVGYVGIGTTDPTYALDVAGNIGLDEYVYHNGDTDTYIQFDTDEINFVAGAAHMIYMNEGGGGDQADKVTINNDLADVDFQIKGENDANLFRTDAANDKIGIGTDSPKVTLDIHHSTSDVTSLDNDTGGGEVIFFGTEDDTDTLAAGKLMWLDGSTWMYADADSIDDGAEGLLAIALGTAVGDGLLIRGWFDATTYLNNFSASSKVYVSTTAAEMDTAAPAGSGDYIRLLGYCTPTANVIYFNPSNDWIELS